MDANFCISSVSILHPRQTSSPEDDIVYTIWMDCVVSMKLVAPPLYVLTTHTIDQQKGIDTLSLAGDACRDSLVANKGKMVVKEAARAVSERDERLMANTLEVLEHEKNEVDDDSDSDTGDIPMNARD